MDKPSVLYRETRERLTDLLMRLEPAQLEVSVPSTPRWTVKDVVAHLAGLPADWLDGRIEGYGGETWTEAQVETRKAHSLQQILDEWTDGSVEFEARMDDPVAEGFPDYMPFLAVADVAIHEHDIRGALDLPGARDSAAVELGMKTYVTGVRQRHAGSGLPPMLIRETDGRDWPVGQGDAAVTVAAPRFDLWRAMAGRRSRDQVAAFDWAGDGPDPYVDLFVGPGFSWAGRDLDH